MYLNSSGYATIFTRHVPHGITIYAYSRVCFSSRLMKEQTRAIHMKVLPDGHRACRLSEQRYPAGIAAKAHDVVVDPLHS